MRVFAFALGLLLARWGEMGWSELHRRLAFGPCWLEAAWWGDASGEKPKRCVCVRFSIPPFCLSPAQLLTRHADLPFSPSLLFSETRKTKPRSKQSTTSQLSSQTGSTLL